MGCSPWGRKESNMPERLHFQFSLSYIGEGNGNPLQCSCLENPRDGRAWWAAIYGVTQSRTRLKRLCSSSSSRVTKLSSRKSSPVCLQWLSRGSRPQLPPGVITSLYLLSELAPCSSFLLLFSTLHPWSLSHWLHSLLCTSSTLWEE